MATLLRALQETRDFYIYEPDTCNFVRKNSDLLVYQSHDVSIAERFVQPTVNFHQSTMYQGSTKFKIR